MTSVAQEDHFTLGQHGFAVRSHHFDIMTLDKERVERECLLKVEKLVRREIENVAEVVCFDWRVRISSRWQVSAGNQLLLTSHLPAAGPCQLS